MNRTTPTELANMCLITSGDKVLVQEKAEGLVFPGGHIEDGESITDSVVREIYEETGLVIDPSNITLSGGQELVS